MFFLIALRFNLNSFILNLNAICVWNLLFANYIYRTIGFTKMKKSVLSRYKWILSGKGGMPSMNDVSSWKEAANILTHEGWGRHIIRLSSRKTPTEVGQTRPFTMTVVPTMHPTWAHTDEQFSKLVELSLQARKGDDSQRCLTSFLKEMKGKPSLREKPTWNDDAKITTQMSALLGEFCTEASSYGIHADRASWLLDGDGRVLPPWEVAEPHLNKQRKLDTIQHTRNGSASVVSLFKAVGEDPRMPFDELLKLAREQKTDGKTRKVLRQKGGDKGKMLAESSKLKESDDFWCCLLYTSPSPRDQRGSRMPSSA